MSYFFVTTLQVFFCIALLSGVLWSRNDPPSLRPLTWTLLTGLIAGVLAGLFIHGSQPVQLLLVGAEVMVSLLFVLSFWWASTRIRYLWQGILIFGAARHWALDPNLGGLTSTHVLNTDLLLNLTAVVLAFAILCLAGVLCAMLLRRIRGLYWPLTLILLVMIWLPLSGNLPFFLMNFPVVPLAKSLLWLVTIGCAVVVIAGQLWWDKVASQPPQLSEAVPVTLGSDGMVRLPVEQLRDGKLHRFVWVADDGKAVRFFVINRYPDKLRFGVVFDACLLCGDQGYVMEGNQVICVACGVHIFIPSIGKAGGCNPVPIENWHNDEKELVIPGKELATGVNYFSTVMTIKVTDPVDGSTLTNTSADYKYSYGGKTWFFSSEANYERFRETPEQFVPADMREE
ncbi:DUF2318 domain-containing protein [Escherichia coli]